MATEKQIKDFALVNAGLRKIEKPGKNPNGSLYLDGVLYSENKPYPLLQYIKKELINKGVTPTRLQIKKM